MSRDYVSLAMGGLLVVAWVLAASLTVLPSTRLQSGGALVLAVVATIITVYDHWTRIIDRALRWDSQ